MGYLCTPPQSGFITTAKQRATSSTNNYVDLDHAISSIADVIVFVNFVKQDTTNLSLTTSTRITLGGTLVSSDIVEIHYLGKAVNTQTPSTGTVTNDMLVNSSITLNGSAVSLGGSATVGGDNEPMFHATLGSDTTVSHDTLTIIPANNTTFNLGSAYDTSTYKFTPQVAGKYYMYAYAQCNMSAGEANNCITYLVKNSTTIISAESIFYDNSATRLSATAVAIIDLNGSTDFVQAKVLPARGGGSITLKSDSDTKTNFGGFKLIT